MYRSWRWPPFFHPNPTGDDGSSTDAPSTTDPTGVDTDDPTGEFTSSGGSINCPPGLDACGVLCVDFQTDATNCGGCGITCVVPNSESSCVAGGCSVGSCTPGFFDCDENAANGCEAQEGCIAGRDCTTTCGSTGVTSCNGCDVTCEIPAETCNAQDDNCDGSCDEGALPGCREPVHRANGPNGHYYTNVLAETTQAGRSLESESYWWMYSAQHEGTSALYLCDLGSAVSAAEPRGDALLYDQRGRARQRDQQPELHQRRHDRVHLDQPVTGYDAWTLVARAQSRGEAPNLRRNSRLNCEAL